MRPEDFCIVASVVYILTFSLVKMSGTFVNRETGETCYCEPFRMVRVTCSEEEE
jgi:hypothetical protein